MINNIIELDSKRYVSIAFQIASECNFSCYYCLDVNREKVYFSSVSEMDKFINFIKKIDLLFLDYDINLSITGGEPLLNIKTFYITKELLNLELKNKLFLNITTNGSLLGKYLDDIDFLRNKENFEFEISYHFDEYKNEKLKKDFINNISFLEINNINYSIKFLLPANKEDFYAIKEVINYFLKDKKISKSKIILDIIRNNGGTRLDYDNEILSFYEDFFLSNIEIYDKYNQKNIIKIGNNKEQITSTEISYKKQNNFYKYRCYPFKNTFFVVSTNLEIHFVGCKALNKIYSIESFLDYISTSSKLDYVYCLNDFCDCPPLIGIPKKYDKNAYKYDEILNKISKIFKFKGYNFSGIKHLSNNSFINKIEINYKIENKNIFIIFEIENFENGKDYMFSDGNIGVHFFLKNSFGQILRNIEIDKNFLQKVLLGIKKVKSIFYKILLNEGK